MPSSNKKPTPRQIARSMGEKTYLGTVCSKCSGTLRAVANGGCLPCQRASTKRFKRRNKDRMNAESKAWYHANKERSRATTQEWILNNYVRNRKTGAKWYQDNKERLKEVSRAWREANKERRLINESNRRAKKAAAPGRFTLEQVKAILSAQDYQCAYCDASENLQIDHVIPISRGGSNWPWNLQWLCAHHNASKNAKTDQEYREFMGYPAVEEHLSMVLWRAVFAV